MTSFVLGEYIRPKSWNINVNTFWIYVKDSEPEWDGLKQSKSIEMGMVILRVIGWDEDKEVENLEDGIVYFIIDG